MVAASITSVRRAGAPGNAPVVTTMRGMGSSGRRIPAVAASVPAHGPAAFTTTGVEIEPSRVRTPVTAAAVRLDLDHLHAQSHVGAGTASERRVPLRQPGRVRDAVVGAERRTHDVVDRDARRDGRGLVGREELRVDAERSLQLRSRAEVRPVLLVANQEEVPVLHDVERQPVLLA